jgi:hypothetical protein
VHFKLVSVVGGLGALLLVTDIAMAESDPEYISANYVIQGCRAFVKEVDQNRVDEGANRFRMGRCAGIIEALRIVNPCVPLQASQGQVIRVVVKFIDDQPARLHEDFRLLTIEALRKTWPCR